MDLPPGISGLLILIVIQGTKLHANLLTFVSPDLLNLRARLYQVSASTLQQLCNDASDSVLIDNNGDTQDWSSNIFSSDTVVFNENRVASVIAELTLTLGINGP